MALYENRIGEIVGKINGRQSLHVYTTRLHGFDHFYIQCFASLMYGFPFKIDELGWYELDVCEFVFLLVEMLWYGIGGLVLYIASTMFSESVTQCSLVCPIYSAGASEMFLHQLHWIM